MTSSSPERVPFRVAPWLAAGACLVLLAAALLSKQPLASLPAPAAPSSAKLPTRHDAAPPLAVGSTTAANPLASAELARARALGLSHLDRGEDDLALQSLVPVYRAQPGDDTVALAIAESSLHKRDYKTAQGVVSALRAPEAPEALRVRGLLAEQANHLAEALALYDRALPGLSRPYPTREHRACVLAWLGRFDEAAAADAELASDPKADLPLRRRSRVGIAELTAWKKDFDGALTQLATLLHEEPHQLDALLLQGQVLEWQARYAEAKRSYSTILELEPGNAQARMRLDKLLWVP